MDSSLAIKQLKAIAKFTKGKNIRLAAEWEEPWKVLVATILSAQNRDTRTIDICENFLFKRYNTPAKLGKAPLKSIEKIIHSINYYKTKARHIKETAKIISNEGIGRSVEELIRLPGVGRKTANVYLVHVHKEAAIGVDTHVGRVSRKLGWTTNTNPHKVEKDLEKLFPKKYWNSINYIVVRFGQTIGRSREREDEVLERLKRV
jgi:endonuclease-3